MAETKTVNYKRAAATDALVALMTRVSALNNSKTDYYRVSKLYVFGSYLKGTPTVHDLDIALELKHTDYYAAQHEQYLLQHGEVVKDKQVLWNADAAFYVHLMTTVFGRSSYSYLQKMLGLQDEYLKKLKNRSRILSLHMVQEMQQLNLAAHEYVCLVSDGRVCTDALNKLLAS